MDETNETPVRNRNRTADYPRPKSHNMMKERTPSAKKANKSLVTKINEKPSASIPDVISSHESHSSSEITNEIKNMTPMETRDKASNMVNGEITNGDIKEEIYETPSPQVNHMAAKVDSTGSVEDVKVQVHRPATSESMESNSFHFTDEVDSGANPELNLEGNRNKVKQRTSSFTHSEIEAFGVLDDVLREFNDVGDNLDEVSPTGKDIEVPAATPDFDPSYESMADIKEMLTDRNDEKQNGVNDNSTTNYNITNTALQQKDVKNELVPPANPEPVYAKPIKPISNTGSKINPREIVTPPEEKAPIVPPKRFIVDDSHEIKFSPLRKTSPSASLSKSLNNTVWANATEVPSPKRKPLNDNNDNFSLKRGQLSGPIPISIDDNYVEPPRDYDVNATLSSIGKSSNDESYSRDTWGSMTSSSTGGSRKVKKEFRPEALKMIAKSKAEKEEHKKIEGRRYDGLVNRSFQLREASLKETAPVKEDAGGSENENGSDYASIKNEADLFLEGYERMRASSEGKKELALKSRVQKTTNVPISNQDAQGLVEKGKNALPADTPLPLSETTKAVLNQTDDKQVANGISGTQAITTKVHKTKNTKEEKTKSHLEKNEENDSDDENLIRLMETGVSAEDSTDLSLPEPKHLGYVPRALRMSFGQSWQGIRKDRREWKSREVRQTSTQALRKGKTLSNRFDDQDAQLEMLF